MSVTFRCPTSFIAAVDHGGRRNPENVKRPPLTRDFRPSEFSTWDPKMGGEGQEIRGGEEGEKKK